MRRTAKERILLVALMSGAIASFAMGFHHVKHRHRHRARFEQHVARVCLEAAHGVEGEAERNEPPPRERYRYHP